MEKENQILDKKETPIQSFWEILRFVVLAVIIVIPIRIFIIEPFVVSGTSMFPTFLDGDYLMADKLSYYIGNPHRNDVVIFLYPYDPKNNPDRNILLKFFDPGKSYIKRVIGLPNETVDIKGATITITNDKHKDGLKLDESYILNNADDDMHITLKSDEYFVLGDNRTGSSDSRFWGPLKRNFFEGRPLFRLLPLNHINLLPGHYKQVE